MILASQLYKLQLYNFQLYRLYRIQLHFGMELTILILTIDQLLFCIA